MKRWLVCVGLGIGLFAVSAVALPVQSIPGAHSSRSHVPGNSALLLGHGAVAHAIALPSPDATEGATLKAAPAAGKRAPLKIGFTREIPMQARRIELSSLTWNVLPDGRRAAQMTIESPTAASIRAELNLVGDSSGLKFRFAGKGENAQVFGPYSWTEIASGGFWSPVLEGSAVVLEIETASGSSVEGRTLTVSRISHLASSSSEIVSVGGLKDSSHIGRSQSCNIDIACLINPSESLLNAAAAVAKIIFTNSSGSFLCTGTLINSVDAMGAEQQIPYFVTANHCIGSQSAASTMNFFWSFDATACNSKAVPNFQTTAGGATLLYTSGDVDLTLVRMNNPPPATAYFAGWDSRPIFPGSSVIDLHHPAGDLKKYSSGRLVDVQHGCQYDPLTDDCASPLRPQGMYLIIDWLQGLTEGGSSGSGLFTLDDDGEYRLRGVLHAGNLMFCPSPQGYDEFSQFSLAYPAISHLIASSAQAPAGPNAIEYYNVDLDHYFMTASPGEAQSVETGGAGPGWVRTGYSFPVSNFASPALSGVCRFYGNTNINPNTGKPFGPNSHFYTADADECAQVRLDPGWLFETDFAFAVGIPVTGMCPNGTIPVYRVYNNGFLNNNSNHRYTTNVDVYQFMLTQNSAPPIFEGSGGPVTSAVRWKAESTVMCAPLPPS
jgi:hypothetical protein